MLKYLLNHLKCQFTKKFGKGHSRSYHPLRENSDDSLSERQITALPYITLNSHKEPGHTITKTRRHIRPVTRKKYIKIDSTPKWLLWIQLEHSAWDNPKQRNQKKRDPSNKSIFRASNDAPIKWKMHRRNTRLEKKFTADKEINNTLISVKNEYQFGKLGTPRNAMSILPLK